MTWISDRLPTCEDADKDGDVCLHWEDRNDVAGIDEPYIYHTEVKPAMRWRHTDYWLPKELM